MLVMAMAAKAATTTTPITITTTTLKGSECNDDNNHSNEDDCGYCGSEESFTILLGFEAGKGVLCEEVITFLDLNPGSV